MSEIVCPCGSNKLYDDCCGLFIDGGKFPLTPEQLMRSRYTAYTKANVDYIAATMRSPAADGYDKQSAKAWAQSVEWDNLQVLNAKSVGMRGYVEFIANFWENKKHKQIHEKSEFHLIDGKWFYVRGE